MPTFPKSKLESLQNYHWMHEIPKLKKVKCKWCLEEIDTDDIELIEEGCCVPCKISQIEMKNEMGGELNENS